MTLQSIMKTRRRSRIATRALKFLIALIIGYTIGVTLNDQLYPFSFHLNLTQLSVTPSIPSNHQHSTAEKPLRPPPIHTMTDEELLRKASTVSPDVPKPFDQVPRIAFMFLVKDKVELAPLWEKFFKGNEGLYSIYVHSSKTSSAQIPPLNSVFYGRNIPSKKVGWGRLNMMEAERRLLASALLEPSNERFVLLSESCIPIHNFGTVYRYLTESTESYVQVYDQPGLVGRGRYKHQMHPIIKSNQWRKGAQWSEMNRELAQQVVSDNIYFPLFKQHYHGIGSCCSDEHYLPTFVNIKHGMKNSNRSLTWTDWSWRWIHPASYQSHHVNKKFLEHIRGGTTCDYNGEKSSNVCFLFARKFRADALERLMNLSEEVFHY